MSEGRDEWNDQLTGIFCVSVLVTAAAITLMIVGPILAVDATGRLVNPQGYALSSLLP